MTCRPLTWRNSATLRVATVCLYCSAGASSAKTVLVRASGLALTAFGVTGVMPDPQLVDGQGPGSKIVLASNADWGGDPLFTAIFSEIGAFSWSNPNNADSAVLLTLAPGPYTAQVTSVSGASGTALGSVSV